MGKKRLWTHTGGISYNESQEVGSLTQQVANESSWMVPLVSESGRSSQVSEESTSGSNEPDTESCSSANPTPIDDESSPDTGLGFRALRTWRKLMAAHDPYDFETWGSTEQAGNLSANADIGLVLISSAEDFPVKTSQSQDDEQDSAAPAPVSSSSSPESLTLFSDPEGGSSLRTFPDSFPPTVDGISPSYLRRWPTSGFTTSPGECWTADTSECPSDGGAYSSLPDVLEADVHPRFYLSPKAAAGILRRAERRDKSLPEALESALHGLTRNLTDTESTSQTVRRLTPTECERLQGFPDGWTWVPSTGKAEAM